MGTTARPDREAALKGLAAAINATRTQVGSTQEDVSYEAGIALRTFQGVEAGRVNPGYLTLVAIAGALGARIGDLLNSADEARAHASRVRPRGRRS